MTTKVYVVTDAGGKRFLVRAHTAKGAVRFKREQAYMKAEMASQDTLIELAGAVSVEDATVKLGQVDIEDEGA